MPEKDGASGQHHGAKHDLQGAKAEYQPAHYPQPLERQFQTNHKQQQHDAEMGDRLYRRR